MTGSRLEELAIRRKMLLLRSARLRTELATDQRYVLHALGGFDRGFSLARSLAKPLLLGGAGVLLLTLLRRATPARVVMRGLFWVSMARRLLPLVGLMRAFRRARPKTTPPS